MAEALRGNHTRLAAINPPWHALGEFTYLETDSSLPAPRSGRTLCSLIPCRILGTISCKGLRVETLEVHRHPRDDGLHGDPRDGLEHEDMADRVPHPTPAMREI